MVIEAARDWRGVFADDDVTLPEPRSGPRLVEASFDPFENDMGEGSLQRFISEALRPLIEWLLGQRGQPTFVGADQYVGWHPDDPKKVVAPDVYVLPGVAPGEEFEFWKTWQTGVVPSFALEIVSKRKPKDYVDAPLRYAELGVQELVIFDPRPRRNGVRWQVYRQVPGQGFVKVESNQADRVQSEVLGCWLRAVGTGKELRVRLAEGPLGENLVLTAAEAAEVKARAEQVRADSAEAKAEVERARADSAEAKAEAERLARAEADAEIARLRAELAQREKPRSGERSRRARS